MVKLKENSADQQTHCDYRPKPCNLVVGKFKDRNIGPFLKRFKKEITRNNKEAFNGGACKYTVVITPSEYGNIAGITPYVLYMDNMEINYYHCKNKTHKFYRIKFVTF